MGNHDSGTTGNGQWQPPAPEGLAAMLPGYEVEEMLGRGGMGAVYKGRQASLDRMVAIKILSDQLAAGDSGFAERFKNEARAMAKLEHPGIVAVHDFGETESGLLYIVMQYVDGTDVARMISSEGRLHTDHAMAITAHVCDALAYAHERGIIHRDIKPANIMVGYDGVVKVADFGLAKAQSVEGQTAALGLTQSGMMMGTLHYMAPEMMILDSTQVDQRADLYAIGVMLYQMLTGRVPQGIFELPSLQVKGLDPRYDGIIERAMREDRDKRYQSAGELRGDLDGILTQPVAHVEAPEEAEDSDETAAGRAAVAQAPPALPTGARPKPSRPGGGGRKALVAGTGPTLPQTGRRTVAKKQPRRTAASPAWVWILPVILLLGGGGWWLWANRNGDSSGASAEGGAGASNGGVEGGASSGGTSASSPGLLVMGMQVQKLDAAGRAQFSIPTDIDGLLVKATDPLSRWRTFQEGTVIAEVNGSPAVSVEALRDLYLEEGRSRRVRIYERGQWRETDLGQIPSAGP